MSFIISFFVLELAHLKKKGNDGGAHGQKKGNDELRE